MHHMQGYVSLLYLCECVHVLLFTVLLAMCVPLSATDELLFLRCQVYDGEGEVGWMLLKSILFFLFFDAEQ